MRRSILVPALILVLTVVFCGEASSRSHPYSYTDPGVGDDHTWGGDFQVGSVDPDDQQSGLSDSSRLLDVFITHIFFKWLGFTGVEIKSDAEADYFIQHQIGTTTPDEPVTTNNRGSL